MEVSRAQFFEQRHRRFGMRNPERMMVPFWEFMVRSGKWAHWASERFQESNEEHTAPIWCFDRFGMSGTSLSDGRVVFIAGEHEDHYDPDFCIYNDVVIRGPGDQVEILGYPREVFPPTDFHTATLLGDRIIVIGNLGYPADRRPGYTQVFELSVPEFQMKRLETAGEPPGWLSRHTASADGERRILIHGGSVAIPPAQSGRLRKNLQDFSLDLAVGQWQQVTDRDWREFLIRLETRKIIGTQVLFSILERIVPPLASSVILPGGDWKHITLSVQDVPVSIRLEHLDVSIVVEGALPSDLEFHLLEELRRRLEAVVAGKCVLEQLSPEYRVIDTG